MTTGIIFNIQRFCINDGPGIRTAVFFKGCPLNCLWCHNPESKSGKPELFLDQSTCIKCRRCQAVCARGCHAFAAGRHVLDRASCVACGECVRACPAGALALTGYLIRADEVIATVLRDKPFYDASGGGLTLTGGEPMAQFEFALELMIKARLNELNTCLETCGLAPAEQFDRIAAYTDLFLYDYKLTDHALHRRYTGVADDVIRSNLDRLDALGKQIILRCPIIPGINDQAEHFAGIADTANSLRNILEIQIVPYHRLGVHKMVLLGQDRPQLETEPPAKRDIEQYINAIQRLTDLPVLEA